MTRIIAILACAAGLLCAQERPLALLPYTPSPHPATSEAATVMEIETALAKTSLTQVAMGLRRRATGEQTGERDQQPALAGKVLHQRLDEQYAGLRQGVFLPGRAADVARERLPGLVKGTCKPSTI